ncbi:MAG: hypothetical protein M0T78_04890 [Actinomycetota bacterium]|nr:hypothetical protein [Actinomycetota bacterium]
MSFGVADLQSKSFDDMSQFYEKTLAKDRIYSFLQKRSRIFPDDAFAKIFSWNAREADPHW